VKKFIATVVLSLFALSTLSSIGCSGDKTEKKTESKKTEEKKTDSK
jgi:hypothetical protein